MFRGRAQYAGFTPREGDKVEVRALVTLYGARGDYQINVEAIRRAGVGALYEAFLRLKEKLSNRACSTRSASARCRCSRAASASSPAPGGGPARHPDRAQAPRAARADRALPGAGAGPGRGREDRRSHRHRLAPRRGRRAAGLPRRRLDRGPVELQRRSRGARHQCRLQHAGDFRRGPRDRLHHRRLRRRPARRHPDRRRRTGGDAAR
jgi:hypothetical protein